MANDKGWTEQREGEMDVNGQSLFPSRASKEMLKISDTNRFVWGPWQGKLLNAANLLINNTLNKCKTDKGKAAFRPIVDLVDYFGTTQLTMEGISRQDFKDVEIAGQKKKKGLFNRSKPSSTGGDSEIDTETEGND